MNESVHDRPQDRVDISSTFTNQVESIVALSPDGTVDNIHLVTEPRLVGPS